MIFNIWDSVAEFGGTVLPNTDQQNATYVPTGNTRLNGGPGPCAGTITPLSNGNVEYTNYPQSEWCEVCEIEFLFSQTDANGCECQFTAWIPFHPCPDTAEQVLQGLMFSVATGFTDPQHTASHFHSGLGTPNPPSIPVSAMEVGGFGNNGQESIRGFAEFDLAGVSQVDSATLAFTVADVGPGGIGVQPNSGPGGLFGQAPYVGDIQIRVFACNNQPDVSDYNTSGTLIGTVNIPAGVQPGQTYSISVPANLVVGNCVGVQLRAAVEDLDGPAITFVDAELTIQSDACCILVEERTCQEWSCPNLDVPQDCSDGAPILNFQLPSSEFANQNCIDGNLFLEALQRLAQNPLLRWGSDCIVFAEESLPGGSVAIAINYGATELTAQLKIWNTSDVLLGTLDFRSPCLPPYDLAAEYVFTLVAASSTNNCWDTSEPAPSLVLNPGSFDFCN